MGKPWEILFNALRDRWEARQSFVVGTQWVRDVDEPGDELTEDLIIEEQPDWVPPVEAQMDEWRPKSTLEDYKY